MKRHMAISPTLTLWLTATGVAAFGATCVVTYRPVGAKVRTLVVASLKRGLAALDDESLDSSTRFTTYEAALREADRLLCATLRSNPTDTAAIERLATVRWEADVLMGTPDAGSARSLIGIANSRAPRVPEIQIQLGALLYKIGSPGEGLPFMERALALSPSMTGRVVETMEAAGVEPEQVLSSLPRTAELLLGLRAGFARSGRLEEWLSSAEALLPEYPGQLLPSYANACSKVNQPDRLLAHAEQLGVLPERTAEAERQFAIGWAHVGRNTPTLAALAARNGRRLAAGDPTLLEQAGQVAFAAGDAEAAEIAFREALVAFAGRGSRGADRARCYRERGEALERLGRAEEAFDQYRRAIEILPDDPWLRQRFAAWTSGSRPDNRR
jgi:predicted Zn-dependent protease